MFLLVNYIGIDLSICYLSLLNTYPKAPNRYNNIWLSIQCTNNIISYIVANYQIDEFLINYIILHRLIFLSLVSFLLIYVITSIYSEQYVMAQSITYHVNNIVFLELIKEAYFLKFIRILLARSVARNCVIITCIILCQQQIGASLLCRVNAAPFLSICGPALYYDVRL